MKPSEIRGELLKEQAQIRTMLDVTLTFAERPRVDAPGCDDLQEHLVRLTDAIRMHNLREEALLRDLIPSVDAWGPARAAIMVEEHVREHERLYAALLGIPCTPAEFAAAGVAALVHLIGEHMDREEPPFWAKTSCAMTSLSFGSWRVSPPICSADGRARRRERTASPAAHRGGAQARRAVFGGRHGSASRWVWLARLAPAWRSATLLVQPATVLRWHRAGFRVFWGRRSRPARSAPHMSRESHSPDGGEQSALGRRAHSR